MTHTDTKIVQFIHDDGRRVYSVPVKFIVEGTLFVLASSMERAKRIVQFTHLDDCMTFDHDSITTDGENLLRIDDVVTNEIDISVVDLTEMSLTDYPPNEHPDFVGIPER